MNFDFRNSGKSFFIWVGILIIAGIVFYIVINLLTDKKAKERAELFMQAIQQNDLTAAKKMCVNSVNPESYFFETEKVQHYNVCGEGYYSPKKISVSYYVTGTPADVRNVNLIVEKISEQWMVTSIHINYHINRRVKQLANEFVQLLVHDQRQEARELSRDINNHEFEALADFLSKQQKDTVMLTKGEIIACYGKNCQQKPATTKFDFCCKGRCFSVITKHKENYQYISEVRLL